MFEFARNWPKTSTNTKLRLNVLTTCPFSTGEPTGSFLPYTCDFWDRQYSK